MIWPFKRSETRSTNQAPGGDSYWQDFAALRTGNKNPEGLAAVWACVSLISETLASLPFAVYQGNDKVRSHPLHKVLNRMANDGTTAFEFRESMTAAVLLSGNAFARIERDHTGQVKALHQIRDVSVLRLPSGKLAYEYSDNGRVVRLLQGECLHLRGRLGNDGVLGMSPIQIARSTFDLALEEQQHGVSTFRNAGRLSGVLESAATLKPEQRDSLKQSWQAQYSGTGNAGRTAVLEAGLTFRPISMSLQDAEWLASRQFSVEEVARIFRCPPTLIGDLRNGTYSNSSEMFRAFVVTTLRTWMTRWEQAIEAVCLSEAARNTFYVEHSAEGLLRGDSTTRAAFYASGIQSGWMKPSEARELENLPPLEGIDDFSTNGGNPPTTPTAPYPSKEAEQ